MTGALFAAQIGRPSKTAKAEVAALAASETAGAHRWLQRRQERPTDPLLPECLAKGPVAFGDRLFGRRLTFHLQGYVACEAGTPENRGDALVV